MKGFSKKTGIFLFLLLFPLATFAESLADMEAKLQKLKLTQVRLDVEVTDLKQKESAQRSLLESQITQVEEKISGSKLEIDGISAEKLAKISDSTLKITYTFLEESEKELAIFDDKIAQLEKAMETELHESQETFNLEKAELDIKLTSDVGKLMNK